MGICVAGVLVSGLIWWFGGSDSFMYNDEDQLEVEEKQLLEVGGVSSSRSVSYTHLTLPTIYSV